MNAPIHLNDVIEEHAEEAAFLWNQRDEAACSSSYELEELLELDDRLEAHIAGLRVAGTKGWEICQESYTWEDPGEVFAGALLTLEPEDPGRLSALWEAVEPSPEVLRGAVSALGWLELPQALAQITRLIASESPGQRYAGIGGAAVHRHDPGSVLARLIADEDPAVCARALRAVGELGRLDMLQALRRVVPMDEACRFSAAWAAALLGDQTAVANLGSFADSERYRDRAFDLLFRRLPRPSAQEQLDRFAGEAGSYERLAILGAGAIGDPAAVPWLIERMNDEELARVAGDAFSSITGASIDEDNLEGSPAEPQPPSTEPETDDDEDLDADESPDPDLTLPDPTEVQRWWDEHQPRFTSGARYLGGLPIAEEGLRQVLRDGVQRRRAAAALELAILRPGQPLLETRGPAARQLPSARSDRR